MERPTGNPLAMKLSLGVLLIAMGASSAIARAQETETENEDGGVPVVEGEHPGAPLVDQEAPPPPPGYDTDAPPAAPAQGQPPGPANGPQRAPSYDQPQPGYGYGYTARPRYHREPYVEGMPLPPNARISSRVRKGLLIPGIAMFTGGYIAMIFTYSFIDGFSGTPPGTMLIPLIGPFFLMPDAGRGGRGLLALDALLQIGGVTMLILGATLKTRYVTWYGDSNIRVTPLASRRGGGMQLSVAF